MQTGRKSILNMTKMNYMSVLIWIARAVAALIMLQTLYFKFTAQAESVELFTELGIEPWGRIGTGVVELIASVLILIPRTSWMGATLGAGTMAGAILSHLTILGVSYGGDPLLFIYAVIVLICCITILAYHRVKILTLLRL